jgi:CDP-diacylglycerol--serine O-phosphatidyltransferase
MSPRFRRPLTGDPERRSISERRILRRRRRRRRAYIRSIYSLPSLATLLNAVSGFTAIYLASLIRAAAANGTTLTVVHTPGVAAWMTHGYLIPAYCIFLAMVFDGIDGRLARFARHTTDFGGQLDSLADVISFGLAPAFIAICLVNSDGPHDVPMLITRFVWATAALYMSCAALRLARFNVSNEHGEQHHFSFLGLPSPGAAGAVAGLILMQQELAFQADSGKFLTGFLSAAAEGCAIAMPLMLMLMGLLMVSHIRYPHLVNRHLRGRRSFARLVGVLALVFLLIVFNQYTVAIGSIGYVMWGTLTWAWSRRPGRRAVQNPATPTYNPLPKDHEPT